MLSECQKAVEGLCCDTEVMWCDVVCYLVKRVTVSYCSAVFCG